MGGKAHLNRQLEIPIHLAGLMPSGMIEKNCRKTIISYQMLSTLKLMSSEPVFPWDISRRIKASRQGKWQKLTVLHLSGKQLEDFIFLRSQSGI